MGRSIGLSRISTADNSSSLFSVKIFISSPVPAPKSRILPVTVYASIIRSTSCLISPRLVPPEHLAACRRKSRKSDFMSTSASLPHARGSRRADGSSCFPGVRKCTSKNTQARQRYHSIFWLPRLHNFRTTLERCIRRAHFHPFTRPKALDSRLAAPHNKKCQGKLGEVAPRPVALYSCRTQIPRKFRQRHVVDAATFDLRFFFARAWPMVSTSCWSSFCGCGGPPSLGGR